MKAIYTCKNKKQNVLIQCSLLFLLLKISKTLAINAILSDLQSTSEASVKVSAGYSGSNGSKEDE